MKMKLMNQVGVVLLMLTCHFASAQNTNHLKGQSSLICNGPQPAGGLAPVREGGVSGGAKVESSDLARRWRHLVSMVLAHGQRELHSPETAAYINQNFVAVKVDYDSAGPLVAELQRAQAILNCRQDFR